jgi:SAM-dependent methyltransferase
LLKLKAAELLATLYESIEVDPFSGNYNTKSLLDLIGDVVSDKRDGTLEAEDLVALLIPSNCDEVIVDLGCGKGKSFAIFKERSADCEWIGFEVGDSYNLTTDEKIHIYDGLEIPMKDNSAGFVYSKQVFEHVRYPEALIKEIRRVLKPGGYFFGSVSGLEPYHYHSMFNFTPYGFYTILKDNGMEATELIPGADGISVALRHLSKDKKIFPGIFKGNSIFMNFLRTRYRNESVKQRNIRALMFSGHFSFIAKAVK